MRLAIAGKGGTGKTTIAATLARLRARAGHKVLAIDADTNPNLGLMLGVPTADAAGLTTIPRDLLQRVTDEQGNAKTVFAADPEQLVREFGRAAPDGVELMVMGRVDHAGAG